MAYKVEQLCTPLIFSTPFIIIRYCFIANNDEWCRFLFGNTTDNSPLQQKTHFLPFAQSFYSVCTLYPRSSAVEFDFTQIQLNGGTNMNWYKKNRNSQMQSFVVLHNEKLEKRMLT